MQSLKDYSLNLPEQAYHDYDAWSYSIISKYAKDGFSALATLHDKVEPTPSMEFGSLFDSMITRGKKTLDDYAVVDVTVPDAEKKALDYISTATNDKFDDLTKEFIYDRCQECGYQPRWRMDTTYDHLKPYSSYYDTLKSGKKIVSRKDWEDAFEMFQNFRADPYLKELFGTKNSDDIEYIYQSQFCEEYVLPSGKTVFVKVMPDLIVINHKNRTIQLVDLKTSSVPGWNFKENFLKFRYDLQAHVYSDIIALVINKIPEYSDYTILPYIFTDISRSDKIPVSYVYDQTDESQKNGFSYTIGEKTYQYKPWDVLLDEILSYEESKAKVPSYIKLSEPNNLLDILNKSYDLR